MPRPKRSKVVPRQPQSRIHKTRLDQVASTISPASIRTLSSDSDGLVRKKRDSASLRLRQNGSGYRMSGGLGPGDIRNAHHGEATKKAANAQSNASAVEAQSQPIVKRTRPNVHQIYAQKEHGDTYTATDAPGTETRSAKRVPSTPSFMSSFRPRPRQGSILRMVEQRFASASKPDEQSNMNYAPAGLNDTIQPTQSSPRLSRLSVRIPSVTSTLRKRSVLIAQDDDSLQQEFPSPATPLQMQDRQQPSSHIQSSRIGSHPRATPLSQLSSNIPSSPRNQARNSHKFFLDALKSKEAGDQSRGGRKSLLQLVTSDLVVTDASSPESTPTSSPQPNKRRPTSKYEQPRKKKKIDPILTVTLQSMIPSRRKAHGALDAFDIPSSGDDDSRFDENIDDDDADELNRPVSKRRRRAKKPAPKTNRGRPKTTSTPASGQHKSRLGKQTRNSQITYGRAARQEDDDANSVISIDDGNDIEDSSQTEDDNLHSTRHMDKSLVSAAMKFKEVDRFELSFESCDLHGGSSSPWR